MLSALLRGAIIASLLFLLPDLAVILGKVGLAPVCAADGKEFARCAGVTDGVVSVSLRVGSVNTDGGACVAIVVAGPPLTLR